MAKLRLAFLPRVANGNGRIAREMALGSGRLDLCVEFRGRRYALEVKTAKNYAGEKSHAQLAKYLDTLGLVEGWMPIFDPDPPSPGTKNSTPATSPSPARPSTTSGCENGGQRPLPHAGVQLECPWTALPTMRMGAWGCSDRCRAVGGRGRARGRDALLRVRGGEEGNGAKGGGQAAGAKENIGEPGGVFAFLGVGGGV